MKKNRLVRTICFLGAVVLQAQLPVSIRGSLPSQVQESSGLLLLDEGLVTHNDSGNEPLLYILDTLEFKIKRSVRLLGVSNTDWEDLAEDAEYIYIADIGNNRGTRTDLNILKLSKADFAIKDGVFPKRIDFAYEDQSDFTDTQENDWDAEAIVSKGDSLLIFTKQRKSGGTAVYAIPKEPGTYLAKKIAEAQDIGLITGATSWDGNDEITLVGYTTYLQPFLVSIPKVSNTFTFPGVTQRQFLNLAAGQIEAICALAVNRFLVSSESFSNSMLDLSASVYEVNLPLGDTSDADLSDDTIDSDSPETTILTSDELKLIFQKSNNVLTYQYGGDANPVRASAIFDAAGRQLEFNTMPKASFAEIPLRNLRSAVYYFVLYLGDKTLTRPFLYY
jgi:hypothetical protein